MGVHGLWQLLSSTGKPVPLESLEGKVLAVDVSVWLHQLSKGMRDSSGNPVANAHLHGLFTRICKLLYYRIKPIFVFDGGVPALKKQTLASRRNKREDAERTSTLMQQKILTNLIRGQVLKEAYGLDKLPEVPSTSKSSSKGNKEAIFELPPVPESSQQFLQMKSSEDREYNERRELQKMVESNYEDINKIDVESEDFKSLPLEIQHEIINDIRLSRKNYNLSRITELPEEAQDFSSYQMKKILKHSKLTSRQDTLRKELNERQTKKLSLYYGKNFDDYDEVMSQRVMSEDSAHYLLAKRNLTKKTKEQEKLVKGYLGAIEEENDNMEDTGCDMLLDSDDDNVDILEESKLIFNELSEKKEDNSDAEISNGKNKSTLDSERRPAEENTRFKAVIEIESDSDSDSADDIIDMTVDAIKVKEKKSFNPSIDDTEDHDLQMAIELSLKETGQTDIGTKGTKMSQGSSIVPVLPKNSENVISVVDVCVTDDKGIRVKERKGVDDIKRQNQRHYDVISKNTVTVRDSIVPSNVAFENKDNSIETESIITISKSDEKSTYFKKSDTDLGKTYDKVIDSKFVQKLTQNKKLGSDRHKNTLFKRRISDMSSDSTESTGDTRKIKVIDLSDDENVSDSNLQEDSSQSEDDFIEVKVDLTKVVDDELFPASMFETISADTHQEPLSKKQEMESNLSTSDKKSSSVISSTEDVILNKGDLKSNEINLKLDDTEKESIKTSNKKDENIPVTLVTNTADDESEDDIDIPSNDGKVTLDKDEEVTIDNVDCDDDEKTRLSSPRVTDLALQFESVNEQRVKDMSINIREENHKLRLEQGRQERLAMSITDQMHSEAQELLQLFGIPYIVSPTEAEAQCAQLELSHQSHGTITDDSDIWLFGGKCVFKNFFNQQKHVECFKIEHISTNLGLTRENLINIALLCGSDYTEGIRSVGPVTAMEIMAQFPGTGLDGLRKFKNWWEKAQNQIEIPINQSKFLTKLKELDVTSDFPSSVVVEAYLSPTVDDSCDKCTCQKLNWNNSKTDEVLLPVMKRLADKQTQRGIMSYFQPEVYIQPAAVKSKRLQKVVNKFVNPGSENVDTSENEVDNKNDKKGKKRKNAKENDTEQEQEGKEAAKAKKSRKRRKNDGSMNSDTRSNVPETEHENPVLSAETIEPSEEINLANSKNDKNINDLAETDDRVTRSSKYFKGGNKVDGSEHEVEIDKMDGRQGRKKRKTITSSGNKNQNKSGKGNSIKSKRSDVIDNSEDDDSDCRSSIDSSSDNDSEWSYSEDDERVVRSGLNVEEILGLKMGCAMDEMSTVGSELDVQEILNLKMGCKLDEITEGNDPKSKSGSRVYERLVNVNEILHLDSGTDQFLSNTDHEPEEVNVGAKPDNIKGDIRSNKKNVDITSDDSTIEEETTKDMNVDYSYEGGFIREEDDSDDVKQNDNDDDVKYNDKIVDSNINNMIHTDMVDNKTHSDVVESDITESNSDKNKELGKSVNKNVLPAVSEPKQSSRLSRNRNKKTSDSNTCSTGKQKTIDSSDSMEIKTEPMEVDVTENTRVVAASSSHSVETVSKAKNSKNDKVKSKNIRNKISEIMYTTEPLKPIVTGLPWADRKKGKRKVQSSKTSGLKLVPKETVIKSEKKQAPQKSIGCVNLSESDSDS
ncbi:nucleotide-excision repair [Mactra antiquata]